jgi:AcrR family transcriptional regulator
MAPRNVTGERSSRLATPEKRRAHQVAASEQQRDRLLGAMVEIVAHGGYARTSIGELARRAGVSRGTFYELFDDKSGCFIAAFSEQESRLRDDLHAGEGEWPDRALEAVLERLVSFASERPRSFEFLFHEALLAGPEATRRRDELGRWILGRVRDREARAGENLAPVAAPTELILGGVLRLVTMHTKAETLEPKRLSAELADWVAAYRGAEGGLRWQALTPVADLTREPAVSGDPEVLRRSVPKGRHGLSAEALRALQRERIAYGTARAIHRKGYAEATVSDIVASSGVSRDVFYAEFHDKHQAFDEAAKLVFEQLLATMASAYYGATTSWPERVWSAGEAFARFLEDYPVLAHFLFVGTSSPHPQVERVNEYVLAFKVFIEDGFAYGERSAEVPGIASEALVCVVLAVVAYQIREERVGEIRGLIPAIVYTVICPFLGRHEADAFISRRTRAALGAA